MSFPDAIRSAFSQYATFRGRARRSEYWWFSLFLLLVGIVASVLDGALGVDFEGSGGPVSLLVNLAVLLPSLAVAVRRLHDIDRTGWWLLLALIPIVGWIVLLVFALQNGTPGPNRFGPSPKS
ncbi:DUF805 domain-containing protein [Micromonospora maris]|uniref:DUF805 domain-containing protein n=1 Tax=Micromonospora maris TaxID=1003110 RepID=A0A9X0LGI5_9ACTN|nr:DUF805 domain-containing protein [Micromonospora maris]AEB44166.1 hypothetical protein VAB18032_15270 [Micromonospora maris AB-18-032]KUJ49654.1 hypothetical protein ADL17_10645 [Micromonospora maris]